MQLSLEAVYQIRACVHIAFFFSGRKLPALRPVALRWREVRWEEKQPTLYDRHGALQITMFPIWHPDIRAGRMWEHDRYHLSQEKDMERWHPVPFGKIEGFLVQSSRSTTRIVGARKKRLWAWFTLFSRYPVVCLLLGTIVVTGPHPLSDITWKHLSGYI